mgnify:CR=1 FL=1
MDDDILEARKSWVDKMVAWQKEHISDRQMTLILAFVIGVLASVAGYFLHGIVHEIQILLTSGFVKNTYNLLFLLFPIVGIYLTSLFIKYVVRDNISHGITRVLYAISTKNSKLRGHNCWSSVVVVMVNTVRGQPSLTGMTVCVILRGIVALAGMLPVALAMVSSLERMSSCGPVTRSLRPSAFCAASAASIASRILLRIACSWVVVRSGEDCSDD